MFVQLIEGRVSDRDLFEQAARDWQEQCRPGAIGFLGSTEGVTADGTAIIMARFASGADAAANAGRSEQDAWWSEAVKAFDGSPTFRETTEVTEWGGGGSDDARFVQVMKSHPTERRRIEEMYASTADTVKQFRPDILGGTVLWFGDEAVEFAYFTSEEEARIGEQQELPDELKAMYQEMMSLQPDIQFLDLRQPVLVS